MANINTYSSASVSFTDEEKEILQKAHDLLKETAHDLWEESNDTAEELSWEIGDVVDGIERAISGKFQCLG